MAGSRARYNPLYQIQYLGMYLGCDEVLRSLRPPASIAECLLVFHCWGAKGVAMMRRKFQRGFPARVPVWIPTNGAEHFLWC